MIKNIKIEIKSPTELVEDLRSGDFYMLCSAYNDVVLQENDPRKENNDESDE